MGGGPTRAQQHLEPAPRRGAHLRGGSRLRASPRFAFPPGTLDFLADLGAHNTKPWFDADRDRYRSSYLEPAVGFVEAIGPALADLVPGIASEPRVNGSIFRINRLVSVVAGLEDAGHGIGGETLTRTPRGFTVDDDRERFLRHRALYVHDELAAALATDPELIPTLLRHWRDFVPLRSWLMAHVQ